MIKKIFGRRGVSPPPQQARETVTLGIDDIRAFAAALAARRGYPDDSHQLLARRVCFLERRGLPGLGALFREVTSYSDEPYNRRVSPTRPDGRKGGHCPFAAGVLIADKLDELTSADEADREWIHAPSNPILMIPKIAEVVRPTGRLAAIWWAIDRNVVACTVVDGFRFAHAGPPEALAKADHLGFSRFPEEERAVPPLMAGFQDKAEFPVEMLAAIRRYLGA